MPSTDWLMGLTYWYSRAIGRAKQLFLMSAELISPQFQQNQEYVLTILLRSYIHILMPVYNEIRNSQGHKVGILFCFIFYLRGCFPLQ